MNESKKTPRFTKSQLAEIANQIMLETFGINQAASAYQVVQNPIDQPEVAQAPVRVKVKKIFSPQARQNISQAQSKRFQSEEARRQISLSRGGIRERAYPWFARNALIKDVVSITGLTPNQAANARRLLRASERIPTPTKEQTRKNKSLSHIEAEATIPEYMALLRLVRNLDKKELLVPDGSEYHRLTSLYETAKRPLREHFLFRVILEAYATGIRNNNRFALDLIEVTIATLKQTEIFDSELQFLKSAHEQD